MYIFFSLLWPGYAMVTNSSESLISSSFCYVWAVRPQLLCCAL